MCDSRVSVVVPAPRRSLINSLENCFLLWLAVVVCVASDSYASRMPFKPQACSVELRTRFVTVRTLPAFLSLAPPVASLATEPLVTDSREPDLSGRGRRLLTRPGPAPALGLGGGAMAYPCGAARLAAARLHLPVDPTTRARVAQYEREDPLESVVEAALAAAEEEEQKSGVRPAPAWVMWGGGLVRVLTGDGGGRATALRPLQTLPALCPN